MGREGYSQFRDLCRERNLAATHQRHKIYEALVDPENVIRFVYVTDLSVGRNPQEVLRVLDALQTDELCPCNWQKGEEPLHV